MNKIYTKSKQKNTRKIIRFVGLGLSISGLGMVVYIFAPYVLYQLNFAQVFASQNLQNPIPQVLIVTNSSAHPVISYNTEGNDDLLNAANWFPTYNSANVQILTSPNRPSIYSITIPKLNITNALIGTTDMNLAEHMINYQGTAIPPEKGNAVVFGHSTLPTLYNPNNYKTILANAYKLAVGDNFILTINDKQYTYDIYNITVVNPDDTSVFAQNYDDSYFTLITCTPPGTTFQRLVIKSRLRS
jgi:sortase A